MATRIEAVCLPTDTRVAPWGDPVATLPVLDGTLADAQARALEHVGASLVDRPTLGVPTLVYTDRCWFTGPALSRLLEAGPGRLRTQDAGFWESTGSLQDTPEPGLMELCLREDGRPSVDEIDPVDVDLGLEDADVQLRHPRLQHAARPLRVGAASVHLIQHWTHLVRVNQLAIQAQVSLAKERFSEAPGWQRLFRTLGVLWRAGSINPHRIAATIVELGDNVDIHPTAVVEASALGDGCVVGAHAVVRGSVLGPGTVLDEHATVVSSVLGARVRLGPYGHLRHSTVFSGARISAGAGYQLSAFGRDCFVAWGVAALDLSFGRPISVQTASGRQSTGHHFIGCAIGHEAVVGQGVRLAPGVEIPSHATVVAPGDDLLRQPPEPGDEAVHTIRGGRAVRLSAHHAGHALGSRGHDALLGDDAGDETGGRDVEGEVAGG